MIRPKSNYIDVSPWKWGVVFAARAGDIHRKSRVSVVAVEGGNCIFYYTYPTIIL